MRAGLATLQKIERVDAYKQLEARTARFCDQLNNNLRERGLPFQFAQIASIFWLHAQTGDVIRRPDQIPAHHTAAFARIFHSALRRGVYFAPSGYEVSFMSLAHSDELLERAGAAILGAIEETEKQSI